MAQHVRLVLILGAPMTNSSGPILWRPSSNGYATSTEFNIFAYFETTMLTFVCEVDRLTKAGSKYGIPSWFTRSEE